MSHSNIFGFLVVLYENGTVSLSYLGTAPLIHNVNSAQESKMDYAGIDEELRQLQSLIKNKSGTLLDRYEGADHSHSCGCFC
jgi:hypothetical protein